MKNATAERITRLKSTIEGIEKRFKNGSEMPINLIIEMPAIFPAEKDVSVNIAELLVNEESFVELRKMIIKALQTTLTQLKMQAAIEIEELKGLCMFDVILRYVGADKSAVIKLVKEVTGVGLFEAKKLVDNCRTDPSDSSRIKANVVLAVQVERARAEEIHSIFTAAGATVDIR